MNSLKWSLFFLFGEFNPLACLDQSRKLRGLDCISELTTINFWTIFHCDARCHLGCGQAKPARLSDHLQMETEAALHGSLRPRWPFYCFQRVCHNFFPTSEPTCSYGFPPFISPLQHLCNHLGSAGAVLLVRPRNSLCKPCSSRIFSCSVMGMLLAGKEACSKCASSPSTACATE